MWDILREIITSPTGSFAFILSLIIGIGWVIIKAAKFETKWSERMQHSEKKVDILDNNIQDMKSDISYIKGMIGVILSNEPNALTKSHSPISLTELGKKIATEMGIEQMIEKNWDKIYKCITDNAASKNAYDIQQYCIETASIHLEYFICDEDLSKIKDFAFKAGKNMAYYGSMIGVIIRDAYFKHENINLEEVDKHTPRS